jgi:hypothetical protein
MIGSMIPEDTGSVSPSASNLNILLSSNFPSGTITRRKTINPISLALRAPCLESQRDSIHQPGVAVTQERLRRVKSENKFYSEGVASIPVAIPLPRPPALPQVFPPNREH